MSIYRWHVGNNRADYTPEFDPVCCETIEEAYNVLIEQLDDMLNYLSDICEHDCRHSGCVGCYLYHQAMDTVESVKSLSATDLVTGYQVDIRDGCALPMTHWVEWYAVTDFDHHTTCDQG